MGDVEGAGEFVVYEYVDAALVFDGGGDFGDTRRIGCATSTLVQCITLIVICQEGLNFHARREELFLVFGGGGGADGFFDFG